MMINISNIINIINDDQHQQYQRANDQTPPHTQQENIIYTKKCIPRQTRIPAEWSIHTSGHTVTRKHTKYSDTTMQCTPNNTLKNRNTTNATADQIREELNIYLMPGDSCPALGHTFLR